MTENEVQVDTATSDKRMRCVSMINQLHGGQLKNVRRPPSGLLGWLTRTENKLTRKMHPEILASSHVRGNGVAIDYLLQALLKHSQRARFAFAVPDIRREEFNRWAVACLQHDDHQPVEIHSTSQVIKYGMKSIAPDIWLDLYGDNQFALRMRDALSSRVYPTISVQHGLSTHSWLYDKFLRAMLTPSYACDSLICTSRACQKALVNILEEISGSFNEQFGTELKYGGRTDVIPLCVDTDKLRPRDKSTLRKQLGIPYNAMVLLYVGYLSQVKADLAPLLPMIRNLVAENPSVNLMFMVAGTGPESYSKALLGLVQEMGLATNVSLLREVSDIHKEQLFGAADIFVAPCDSMQESFGLSPVEAMACGLPQVVADWSGYRDTVLDGETGFLIPTCWGRCDGELVATGDMLGWQYDHVVQGQSVALDIKCMHERLQLLIRRPDLRATMSERSRARAVAEFSYASVALRYDELWTQLATIADKVQPRPTARRFDQPAYFNCFGHFSTKELRDDGTIRKTGNNALSVRKLIRITQMELTGLLVFDESLLERLIQLLSIKETVSESISVGQLISLTSDETRLPDTVRRHILLLIKHGIATI